uniref:Chromosome 10 open reading frame 71 n=1 Tax=Anser brachyrhynchus TaxID=132585 RepID=A0A8B9C5C9_9AVES
MQGNKKHTEGHSDSSSIGSLLDDADREVSSLTDRAFRSLCVAELEDSYNEPNLAISPDLAHQFSAKFHPGTLNHAIKLTASCNKLTAKNHEHTTWASTFQQLPKYAPEEKKIAKNNTLGTERKKLNLPVPGPRNNKHVSKVSSLIKTFDKTANQGSGGSLIAIKQPIKNSFQKSKLNHGNNMACGDDTAILSIHKELSEFSEDSQDSHCLTGKHEPQKRRNKIDLSYCDSDGYYPVLIEMSKIAKSNFSRSSKKALKNKNMKVNEPAKKGNFLHSENSAFESWKVHHKKLTEKQEFVDLITEKEAPPVPLPPLPAQLSPLAMSQASVSPQSVSSRMVSSSPVSQAPLPPPRGHPPTLTEEEDISPQQDTVCPPWRRPRTTKEAYERRQTSKEKFTASDETCSLSEQTTGAKTDLDVTPLAKQANSPGSASPTFNITELLTPIIPPKQEVDPMEGELIPLTPPPTDSVAERDDEASGFGDYRSRDSYKAKASSLLFNLKDVRKRVKSIYTPSPMLRALENKNKTKEHIQENIKVNASSSTLQEISNTSIAEKDESNDITSVLSECVHEKDNKTDLTGHFTDNYLTLSSPQTTADLLFHQTGDNLQQDNSKHKDLVKNTRDNENCPMFRHQSEEPNLRKSLPYPALKPYSRGHADTTAGQPVQKPSFRAEEIERQAGHQDENFAFRTLPSQLSPAEDVPYSDIQSNVAVSGHEAQGKRSPSSSEQSFVSTVEQPFQEEPQRSKAEMSADSEKSHEERVKAAGEDELQYYAFISPGTGAAESREGRVTGNEQRSLMKEKIRQEKKEEANGMDSASDSVKDTSTPRSEETQTQPSSSSSKPCLFMIKDNTFRSPQVIRAVKLPLFRSFSLDDTVSNSYKEMEGRLASSAAHSKQPRDTLHAQERGWSALRRRGQQNVREGATDKERDARESESTSAALDPNLLEDTESFSLGKLMEEDEETCALLNKCGKMNEESVCSSKEKSQIRKTRHSLTQPNLGLKNDQAENNPSYPIERKTNYFKNHHLSKRKGGSCAKKIITRETISPVTGSISEDHTYSPVSHEVLEEILHMEGGPVLLDSLECSAVISPRSGSTMHSLVAKEILDSTQRHLLLDSAGEAERLELRGLGERGAGKPPAVPPKTEKALRRAKKLASRRKKMEEQQKKHQTEHTDAVGRKPSHSGQALVSPSPLGYSPLYPAPHSAFPPTETSIGRLSGASAVSPSPSLTQRKLLQDPDSGQYYVIDLPAEVNLKTFYDPETGKYVQVSVPSLEGNLYPPSSSEIRNSPYASYPRVLPLPASSVAVLKSPSQLSEPTWLMPTVPGEPPEDGQQNYRRTETVDTQPYIEPVSYSYGQDAEETQVHLGKDVSPTPNTDLVPLTDLDDFVAEGVS